MPGAADHFARFMSHNSSESYQQLVSGRADCDGVITARDMLQCDNNNKRQPDNHDTDTEEDIEIEDGDRQCTQQKVSILMIDLFTITYRPARCLLNIKETT